MPGETTNQDQPLTPNHETDPADGTDKQTPKAKIYIASLSDYNNGLLHGDWIDANQPPEEIHASVQAMLDASPTPNAEEFAIHDYEGFEAFRLHEYESLDTVSRIANGIVEHGRAFSHWIGFVGTSDIAALEAFEDHYMGQWESMANYAEDLVADLGVGPKEIGPSWLTPYVRIDYEGLGRDLSQNLEVAPDGHQTYIFEPYG